MFQYGDASRLTKNFTSCEKTISIIMLDSLVPFQTLNITGGQKNTYMVIIFINFKSETTSCNTVLSHLFTISSFTRLQYELHKIEWQVVAVVTRGVLYNNIMCSQLMAIGMQPPTTY